MESLQKVLFSLHIMFGILLFQFFFGQVHKQIPLLPDNWVLHFWPISHKTLLCNETSVHATGQITQVTLHVCIVLSFGVYFSMFVFELLTFLENVCKILFCSSKKSKKSQFLQNASFMSSPKLYIFLVERILKNFASSGKTVQFAT